MVDGLANVLDVSTPSVVRELLPVLGCLAVTEVCCLTTLLGCLAVTEVCCLAALSLLAEGNTIASLRLLRDVLCFGSRYGCEWGGVCEGCGEVYCDGEECVGREGCAAVIRGLIPSCCFFGALLLGKPGSDLVSEHNTWRENVITINTTRMDCTV